MFIFVRWIFPINERTVLSSMVKANFKITLSSLAWNGSEQLMILFFNESMIQTNRKLFLLDGWIHILLFFFTSFSVIPLYGYENAIWICGIYSTNVRWKKNNMKIDECRSQVFQTVSSKRFHSTRNFSVWTNTHLVSIIIIVPISVELCRLLYARSIRFSAPKGRAEWPT